MVLVSRRNLILISVAVTISLFILGVGGYLILSDRFFIKIGPSTLVAEQFLYSYLVVTIICLLLFIRVFLKSKKVFRELDKIIELTKYGRFTQESNLQRLGPLGQRITSLHALLNTINENLSDKISAMSGTLDFLTNNYSSPLLITDITGKILYLSREYSEYAGKNRTELIGNYVEDLAGEIIIQLIAATTAETRSPLTRKTDGRPMTVYPLFNRKKELAYLLFVFGKHSPMLYEGISDR